MSHSASELHFQHRFWYESGDHPGAFSPGQLQEIRYHMWAHSSETFKANTYLGYENIF